MEAMVRRSATLLVLLGACTTTPPPAFNGKDLTGWVDVNCGPDTWSVRDGMIVCTGKPTGVLRTERMYENFVMEVEWRHMVDGGNAGIFVWSDALPARGVPFTRSIEVQVMDGKSTDWYTTHGDIFAIHGAKMSPDRPHPRGYMRCLPSEHRSKPAGEWNHYRIRCVDGTIRLEVNGKAVSGGHDISPRKGYVCLESEGSEVHFRNLKITELPPSEDLAADDVATADDGFSNLFDGTLDAFQSPEDWRIANWCLQSEGPPAALATKTWFDEFELVFDARLEAKGEGPDGEFARLSFSRGTLPLSDVLTRGRWHRVHLTVRRDGASFRVDDAAARTLACDPAANAGPLSFQNRGRKLTIANLFVRKLVQD